MRMRVELESGDPIILHAVGDVVAVRQAWQTPALRLLCAKAAEADQGGTNFDGVGFIS